MLKFKPETVERNSSNIGSSATIEATVNIIAQCLVPLALYNTREMHIYSFMGCQKPAGKRIQRGDNACTLIPNVVYARNSPSLYKSNYSLPTLVYRLYFMTITLDSYVILINRGPLCVC